MIRGSCLCGAVTFVVDAEPLWSHHCHCSRCRKSTGSAFTSPLIVPKGAVRYTTGVDLVTRYELPETAFMTHFCSVCNSIRFVSAAL